MFRSVSAIAVATLLFSAAMAQESGDALPNGALRRIGSQRFWAGGSGDYLDLAMSDNGEVIVSCTLPTRISVTASANFLTDVWRGSTGERLFRWKRPAMPVGVSRDGKQQAIMNVSGGIARELELWDTTNGRKLCTITTRGTFCDFSPDGRQLLFVDDENSGRLVVWDSARRTVTTSIETKSGRGARFCRDGKSFVTFASTHTPGRHRFGIRDYQMIRWDAATGKQLQTLALDAISTTTERCFRFADDGEHFAVVGENDRSVEVWSMGASSKVAAVPTESLPCAIQFSRMSQSILVACEDGRVVECELKTKRQVVRRKAAGYRKLGGVDLIADGFEPRVFTSDGKRLVGTGLYGRCIQVFNIESGRFELGARRHQCASCVRFSPDGKTLASMEMDGVVRLWNVETGRLFRELKSDARPSYFGINEYPKSTLGYVGDAQLLAARVEVHSWNLDDEKQPMETKLTDFRPQSKASDAHMAIDCIAINSDRTLLATAANKRVDNRGELVTWPARLWSIADRKFLREFDSHSVSVTFSPDDALLATGGDDGKVRVWETATGRQLHVFEGHTEAVHQLAWSADGRLASVSEDGFVCVWDIEDDEMVQKLDSEDSDYLSLAWSVDGTHLITGETNGTLAVWEAVSPKAIRTTAAHGDAIHSIAVSPQGDRIATASGDGTMLLWDAKRLTPE
ncbi:MAG: WD40 repeat domain-containing protein [Pirellulaceae bacterium]